MAEKTIVEQAAEKVGYGLAMAEDVAGSVKAAVGAAITTLAKSPKKAPSNKAVTETPKKAVAQPAAKKAPAKSAVKKTAAKKAGAKTSSAKRKTTTNASNKAVKKPAKKAGKRR